MDEEGQTDTDAINTTLACLGLCLVAWYTHAPQLTATATDSTAATIPSECDSLASFRQRLRDALHDDDPVKVVALNAALCSRPPCRWEKHTVVSLTSAASSPLTTLTIEYVFDMGHNPAAIEALVRRTRAEYGISSSTSSRRPLR